jgi:AbrB family looped-hinge helix DNA binding protein
MTVRLTIDKAGRLVLPKPVRVRLGLKPGSQVKMTEREGAVTLEPADLQPALKRKSGVWVHVGVAPPDFDIVRVIKEDREERIRHLLGRG